MDYRETVEEVYAEAAIAPNAALCCTQAPVWKLPGLEVPKGMLERNYGCGSVVNPRDLERASRVAYVGVGAGMEALQLAYFLREPGAVVAFDTNAEMLRVAAALLEEAAALNPWFDTRFVELREGDALDLPLDDGVVDLIAQNCLFNIFEPDDLARALRETRRVLRPHGALVLSDPVATRPIPAKLAGDPRLRAWCLSGALPLDEYLQHVVDAGFGTVEVRSRRPYRMLDARRYDLDEDLWLESVELAAFADPIPEDGPCIFTGRVAVYTGDDEVFDDGKGHVMMRDVPLGVCDKTAAALAALGEASLHVTESTWHYPGDGCC